MFYKHLRKSNLALKSSYLAYINLNPIQFQSHQSFKNLKMSREKKIRVLRHFKRAVKKIKSLIRLTRTRWRVANFLRKASTRRCLSFNYSIGLRQCLEDGEFSDEKSSPVLALQRITSFGPGDDVDKRAEDFISNFRRQLLFERQVSLQLGYCRSTSF